MCVLAGATAAVACGGGGGGMSDKGDTFRACAAVEACSVEAGQDCRDMFERVVPTKECVDAMEKATCKEHEQATPPWVDVCFPPCEEESGECIGPGTLERCSGIAGLLRMGTFDCDAVCEAEGYAFFAACGEEYLGEMSDDGLPVCWCSD